MAVQSITIDQEGTMGINELYPRPTTAENFNRIGKRIEAEGHPAAARELLEAARAAVADGDSQWATWMDVAQSVEAIEYATREVVYLHFNPGA
jgi:hypothetical protein